MCSLVSEYSAHVTANGGLYYSHLQRKFWNVGFLSSYAQAITEHHARCTNSADSFEHALVMPSKQATRGTVVSICSPTCFWV